MINQLRAQLYMVRHGLTVPLCLLACAVAAAFYMVLQHQLATGSLGPAEANGVAGLSDVMFVSLLGSLIYGAVVSLPFETRSVHNALLAADRATVVTATTVIAALAVTALSLPYGLAALLARATGEDFTPAVPTPFSALAAQTGELTGSEVGAIITVTLTSAVLTAAKLSVCLPLAFWLKRPLVVMAAGFAWGFVADLLGGAAADVAGLDVLVRLTPFSSEHTPAPGSTGGEMLAAVAVSLVFLALMGLASWLVLRRADIK